MKQICISSDIVSSHLTVNYDDLLDVKELGLQSLIGDIPCLQFREGKLGTIRDEIEGMLSSLLRTREDKNNNNIKAEYLGKIYDLNFRDKHDFSRR